MKKQSKILTLIIPTRNRFYFVKKIILEIKSLKKKLNIIIIDDCSDKLHRNNLSNFLKNYKSIKFIKLYSNRGQSYVCNLGLKLSKTKYVWFFDDDDFFKKKIVSKIISYLNKKKPDAILLPMKQIFKKKIIKKVFPKLNDHKFKSLKDRQQKVSTSCAIFERNKILKISGWDENLMGGTDTDLFLRFSQYNLFQIVNVDPIIVNFAAPFRVTNNFFRQQKAKIFFLKKHWQILTLKRKMYYIISFILCFPLLNNVKSQMRTIYNK